MSDAPWKFLSYLCFCLDCPMVVLTSIVWNFPSRWRVLQVIVCDKLIAPLLPELTPKKSQYKIQLLDVYGEVRFAKIEYQFRVFFAADGLIWFYMNDYRFLDFRGWLESLTQTISSVLALRQIEECLLDQGWQIDSNGFFCKLGVEWVDMSNSDILLRKWPRLWASLGCWYPHFSIGSRQYNNWKSFADDVCNQLINS